MNGHINIREFENIVFFTGAGISAESGIPTYQGKGGIWDQYDYTEYACQRAFDRNPQKVWEFHEKRRKFVGNCKPALGHRIIAEIQHAKPSTQIITQNIDGMHQRANALGVIELHGSMWRVRCDKEGTVNDNFEIPLISKQCACGVYLRPDIVWFEDPLKQEVIETALRAVARCDLLITVGTSAMVFPAAQLPVIALQRKIPTIEINIDKTSMTQYYDHFMQGSAGEMLDLLWNS